MKKWFDGVRKADADIKTSKKIINSLFLMALGILLGVFSKWLGNMAIDDTIWHQHLLGPLDLRNVFLAFGDGYFYQSLYSTQPFRKEHTHGISL